MKRPVLNLKKGLDSYYFPAVVILALTIYIAQKLGLYIPELANNHLNDLLCMPIVLKICLYVVRYVKSSEKIEIPLALQVVTTLLFIVYFEMVLPEINTRYTGDILDVFAYVAGLFLFIALESGRKSKEPYVFNS